MGTLESFAIAKLIHRAQLQVKLGLVAFSRLRGKSLKKAISWFCSTLAIVTALIIGPAICERTSAAQAGAVILNCGGDAAPVCQDVVIGGHSGVFCYCP